GFDASAWTAAPVQAAPTQRLTKATADPVRVTDTLRPVGVTTPSPGVRVYDFGGQYAGWARIAARGAAGATVPLTYGATRNRAGPGPARLDGRRLPVHGLGHRQLRHEGLLPAVAAVLPRHAVARRRASGDRSVAGRWVRRPDHHRSVVVGHLHPRRLEALPVL